MATETVSTPSTPEGTTVGAYPVSRWREDQLPPSGAPLGAAINTQVVASQKVTFTGLTAGVDYFATDAAGARYYRFSVDADTVGGRAAPTVDEGSAAAQRPTGAKVESFPRAYAGSGASATLVSGTLYLALLAEPLRAGTSYSSLTFFSGSTALSVPTHVWACLVRLSDLKTLRSSADDVAATWAGNAAKTFNLASAYTPAADEAAYAGLMVAATTPPSLRNFTETAQVMDLPPKLGGASNTAATVPLADGTAVTSPTGGVFLPWAAVS